MTHLDETEAFIAKRLRPVSDLPLFDQRVAAPEVHHEGAGQRSRKAARERAHAKMTATYTRLAQCLEGHGPLTRKELAEVSGLPVNTVNARISEMRARTDELRVLTDGRRHGESIVHLARKHSLTYAEG